MEREIEEDNRRFDELYSQALEELEDPELCAQELEAHGFTESITKAALIAKENGNITDLWVLLEKYIIHAASHNARIRLLIGDD